MTWRHSTFKTITILLPLAFAVAIAMDIYIPSVPELVNVFNSSPATIQLTLSLFLIFFGIGQLILGPLSDQFGRRRVALLSTVAYIASSFLCATAHTVTALIIFRIFEAISACGMAVSANAIIRDVYSERDSGRMYSYLNGAIAMSPLFAPLIGGYLDIYFGWRSSFLTLAVFGVIAVFIILTQIHETHEKHKRLRMNKTVFTRYLEIFKHRDFRFFVFSGASGMSCLFTFFSISPYLLINDLGVPRQHFGFYFAVMGLLFFIGSIVAGKLVMKIGLRNNVLIGAICCFGGALFMMGWYFSEGLSLASFIVPMIPISLGAAFLIGAGAGGAMEPFGEMAGTAAAMFGTTQFLFASLVGTTVMLFPAKSTIPLAGAAGVLGLIVLLWWIKRTQ